MQTLSLSLLFLTYFYHASCNWQYLGNITLPYTGAKIWSIQSTHTYIALGIYPKSFYYNALWNIAPTTITPYYSNLTLLQHSSFNVNTNHTPIDGNYRKFLYYTQSNCYQYINSSYIKIVYFTLQIVKACFYVQNSTTDIIIIQKNYLLSTMTFIYLRNYLVIKRAPSIAVTFGFTSLYAVVQNLLTLYTLDNAVKIYSADYNFTIVKSIPVASQPTTFYFDRKYQLFLYCFDGHNYYVLNSSNNYIQIYHGYSTNTITKLSIYYPYYILLGDTTNTMYQIDIQINKTISLTNLVNFHTFTLININNTNYVLFADYSTNVIYMWVTSGAYSCIGPCLVCYNTYGVNQTSGLCVKGLVNNVTNASTTNTTNNTNPSTINIINNTIPIIFNTTNNTIPIPKPINNTTPQPQPQPQPQTQSFPWKQALTQFISQNCSILLQISSSKILTQGTIYLIIFLDDLQYYQYHRVNYSQILTFAIQNAALMNNIRLAPQFLDSVLNYTNQGFVMQNTKYMKFIDFHQNNPNSYYFLQTTSSIYVGNFISNAIQFIIIKIIYYVLFFIKKRYGILPGLTTWLGRNTRWWVLFIIMVQNNMITLSFDFFLQFTQPLTSSLKFKNKINVAFASIIFLVIFAYALIFYLLVFRYSSKKQVKIILNNQAKNNFQGCFCQACCRIVRNLVRGFFHSYFMSNYKIQIIGLASTGCLSIIPLLIFRKSYKNTWIYLFILAYHLLFCTLDTILAINYINPHIFANLNYNLMNQINIYGLILITFILIFCKLIIIFRYIILKIKKMCSNVQKNQQQQQQTPSQLHEKKLKKLLNTTIRVKKKQSSLQCQQFKSQINKKQAAFIKVAIVPKKQNNQVKTVRQFRFQQNKKIIKIDSSNKNKKNKQFCTNAYSTKNQKNKSKVNYFN